MRTTLAAVALLLTTCGGFSAAASLTDQERQRLIAHLDMTERWLIDEVDGLSPTQLDFRPARDAWSIREVIDHLVVVGPIYWQDLQTAMKAPPSDRSRSNSDADILWYGIDRTFREKAIPTELPKGQLRDVRAGLESYRKAHAQLVQYVKTTTDDLRSHIVQRQGSDAYQWALLISTHEQRHILQIREVKAHANFPKRP